MKEDRRLLRDRRRKPTPWWSHNTLVGRRKGFRRRAEQQKGGYVDRYDLTLLIILIAITVLNIADGLLTTIILDYGGKELNPIVAWAISAFGINFWIWKFGIVSICLICLCIHSKFRHVEGIIIAIGCIYLVVAVYQLFLIAYT